MLARLVRQVFRRSSRPIEMDPASGYDRWSATYDDETENLLILLDEPLFVELLERVPLRGKVVADVGCGTGRHWQKILGREPAELVGYDLSAGMLAQLQRKYPRATVHQAGADRLAHTADETCDLVISTLTLCHVPDADSAVAEWCRVLRPGGDILLTDYHPAMSGVGDCSFRSRGELVTVKLYVHSIDSLVAGAASQGLVALDFAERAIDESVRQNYAAKGMLPVFERMNGVPILYGLRLHKPGPASS